MDNSKREEAARAALTTENGPWELDLESDEGAEFPDACLVGSHGCAADIHLYGANGLAIAQHIVNNDPATVLAGIEENKRLRDMLAVHAIGKKRTGEPVYDKWRAEFDAVLDSLLKEADGD